MKFEIIHLDRIDSTNIYAYKLAKEGERNIVVVADEQTFGKGRLDRAWFSDFGGLYFSIVLESDVDRFPVLNFLASLCVVKTLRNYSNKAFGIKWPNDIIVNNKKICGILSEVNVERGFMVLGIGINVNNKIREEIKDIATSLKEVEGKEFNKMEILKTFLEIFESYLINLNPEDILREYKENSLTLDEYVKIITPNREILGRVVNITYEGIILQTDEKLEIVDVGDCIHLRKVD
ncbi:biotin--[acetyl-CoA-carboxylase] ligase [Methanotorris formicicus]|uniref:Biotin/acetyl-CoA-carboxylase ligase n=1 Tax=Methanotorris formicicus Mc-S-70 TaxID=647171 RepID=H1KZX5_9EURY|nr:biotin--[acetyl-CoA-carboxylase] ligase [Methanotorris formicicus]EHP85478.1 biotin/acetyl-CoA-carboxylase ligase [Methanotorris formicicus Mc-S-70]